MKYTCRLCDRVTKTTNPTHRQSRIVNNTCKECLYVLEEIKPGVNWLKEYRKG